MTNRIFGSGKKEEYVMLTQEQKETMIAALRGKSVAKENITEEYKKNLDQTACIHEWILLMF